MARRRGFVAAFDKARRTGYRGRKAHRIRGGGIDFAKERREDFRSVEYRTIYRLALFTGIDYTVRVNLKRNCYMVLYKEFVENDRDYLSYEDLKKNFKIKIPDNFNFAYDL